MGNITEICNQTNKVVSQIEGEENSEEQNYDTIEVTAADEQLQLEIK
jgi:hypothetical protein